MPAGWARESRDSWALWVPGGQARTPREYPVVVARVVQFPRLNVYRAEVYPGGGRVEQQEFWTEKEAKSWAETTVSLLAS